MSKAILGARGALVAALASALAGCAAQASNDETSASTGDALAGIAYGTTTYPETGVATGVAVAYQPNLVSLATELFWGDTTGHLVWKHYDAKLGWQAGRDVPVNCSIAGNPTVAVTDVNEWRVFYPCSDRSFWYVDYVGYDWLAPQMICPSGCIRAGSGLSAVYDSWRQYWRVYFVGNDSHVYETSHASGAMWWSGGVDTGAIAAGSPSAVLRRSNGQVNVFYRGTNGHLFDVWFDGSSWHAPWDHAIALGGDPSALVAYDDTEIDVYYTTPWARFSLPLLASQTWSSYYGWEGAGTHGTTLGLVGARKPNDVFGSDGTGRLTEAFASSL